LHGMWKLSWVYKKDKQCQRWFPLLIGIVTPQRPLKYLNVRKEQIFDILFFKGKMSSLRSRHLILWLIGTLSG
jgi:hypothetical protein